MLRPLPDQILPYWIATQSYRSLLYGQAADITYRRMVLKFSLNATPELSRALFSSRVMHSDSSTSLVSESTRLNGLATVRNNLHYNSICQRRGRGGGGVRERPREQNSYTTTILYRLRYSLPQTILTSWVPLFMQYIVCNNTNGLHFIISGKAQS